MVNDLGCPWPRPTCSRSSRSGQTRQLHPRGDVRIHGPGRRGPSSRRSDGVPRPRAREARRHGNLSRPGPLQIIASIYDPPHLQPEPVAPQPATTGGFAGALGLALGLILAFARESLNDRVRNHRNAEEWFGAPVIGTLPRGAVGAHRRCREQGRGRDKQIEALRILRANFQFASTDVSGPTLVVTSAVEDEGKTTVVASLSMRLAIGGKNVIAVESDCDARISTVCSGPPSLDRGRRPHRRPGEARQDALRICAVPRAKRQRRRREPHNDSTPASRGRGGRLRLLPAGGVTSIPPQP